MLYRMHPSVVQSLLYFYINFLKLILAQRKITTVKGFLIGSQTGLYKQIKYRSKNHHNPERLVSFPKQS